MFKRVLLVFTAALIAAAVLPLVGGRAQESACAIPANYDEATQENNTNVLRLFAFLGDDGLFDADPDTISLHFAMLRSIRQYHEAQAASLPDCAQDFNTSYIRALTAMQDVLAYNWALLANPDRAAYFVSRANSAKDDLNEAWAQLSEAQQTTDFVVEERE